MTVTNLLAFVAGVASTQFILHFIILSRRKPSHHRRQEDFDA